MTARRSIKRRPRVVGVIASRADLARAIRMRRPPDLFELRLDCLVDFVDHDVGNRCKIAVGTLDDAICTLHCFA